MRGVRQSLFQGNRTSYGDKPSKLNKVIKAKHDKKKKERTISVNPFIYSVKPARIELATP